MTNSSIDQPTPDHSHDQPQKESDGNASDAHSASWPEIVLHQPEQTTGEEDVPLELNDIEAVVAAAERHEDVRFKAIEVVFMSAEEITKVNRTYLDHDYVTDIITFRLDDEEDLRLWRAHYAVVMSESGSKAGSLEWGNGRSFCGC